MNKPEFKLTSIDYKVNVCKNGQFTPVEVSGFLLDMGLPVKICIRHQNDTWMADDFETGFAIKDGGFQSLDMPEFLLGLHALIDKKIASGEYAKAIEEAKKQIHNEAEK